MGELEWFDACCKLDNAPGAAEETLELIRKAESDAARKGVVGIRDYEMAEKRRHVDPPVLRGVSPPARR